jgi:pyruvate/2-oxoglutarate dehydrogenase complex dihydrolipoamide acyltransferase (E2) component
VCLTTDGRPQVDEPEPSSAPRVLELTRLQRTVARRMSQSKATVPEFTCPKVNGSYSDGRFELYPEIDIGIAVAADGALLVPVIPDADRKSLLNISAHTRMLARRLRAGEIASLRLTWDHRILYGAHGAAFPATIKAALEETVVAARLPRGRERCRGVNR